MTCPFCGNDMELGSISSYNRMSWTPDGEKAKGATLWAKSPNSIVLAEFFAFVPATVEAYYCDLCGKIIIDLE